MLLGVVSRLVQSKLVHSPCIIEGKSRRKDLVMSSFVKKEKQRKKKKKTLTHINNSVLCVKPCKVIVSSHFEDDVQL